MIKRILSLDPAASTGYCITELNENKEATIIEYGYINIDTLKRKEKDDQTGKEVEVSYVGDHCIDLMKKVSLLIDAQKIDHITVEDYFFSLSFSTGATINVAYRTAIHILARQKNIPYTILNVSEWKKFVAGRCTPTKEQKAKWGKIDSKKLFIQQALWEIYKIKFPNHSLSEKTGKPILFRFDIVDVVGQCIFYLMKKRNIIKINCNVPIPPDVVHKGNVKKIFEYPTF